MLVTVSLFLVQWPNLEVECVCILNNSMNRMQVWPVQGQNVLSLSKVAVHKNYSFIIS